MTRVIQIREVTCEDVPSVVALVRDTLVEYGLVFGVGSESDRQVEGLPGSYEGGVFFVAFADGVIGSAGLFPLADGVYELRKMFLGPKARGRGLGQQLLDRCTAWAREHGAKRIVLDTMAEMTRAIALYERNGFVRDDEQIRASRCARGYRLDLRS